MTKDNQIQNTSPADPVSAERFETDRRTLALVKLTTNQTEFEVDFAFIAPNQEAADALSAQLKTETGYTVRIYPDADKQGEYWVEAKTQPMALSAEVLDQCVTRMVEYARQHACLFDGWGTLASFE